MVSLIDSLLPEQWKEVSLGEKGDGELHSIGIISKKKIMK